MQRLLSRIFIFHTSAVGKVCLHFQDCLRRGPSTALSETFLSLLWVAGFPKGSVVLGFFALEVLALFCWSALLIARPSRRCGASCLVTMQRRGGFSLGNPWPGSLHKGRQASKYQLEKLNYLYYEVKQNRKQQNESVLSSLDQSWSFQKKLLSVVGVCSRNLSRLYKVHMGLNILVIWFRRKFHYTIVRTFLWQRQGIT